MTGLRQADHIVPFGNCNCGCGYKTSISDRNCKSRGLIKGQPRRFIAGHQCRISHLEYLINESGCWIWQRGKYPAGYGGSWQNGAPIYAHIAYYEKYKGKIPLGLKLDHLCRTPACVNSDHLEAVTHAVNIQRGKGTKLNPKQVILIREIGRSQAIRKTARDFGVQPATIRQILSRKNWANI